MSPSPEGGHAPRRVRSRAPRARTTTKVVSIHSFRGGTGKSNTTANVAWQLAAAGRRVGVVDTDLQSPGIHVLFGLAGARITRSLNDYLAGRGGIEDAVHDITDRVDPGLSGRLFLVPAGAHVDEIVNVLRGGYDVGLLTEGLRRFEAEFDLDVLLIDTHPGLNEETLFAIAASHALVVVMRPDYQDYEGTCATLEMTRPLSIPSTSIVVNRTPPTLDRTEIRRRVRETYRIDDVTVLPHCDEMASLASSDVFSCVHPDHELTRRYRALAAKLGA